MGHGYRPVVSKIRVKNPNKKATKITNYNFLRYIATREGVDLTQVSEFEMETGDIPMLEESTESDHLQYIANRPRSHGLFGNINTDSLSEVAAQLNKVSESRRSVFRGIISLSETDAKALGYTCVEKWNDYLKSVIPDIARELRLSSDITWVAAFHAEEKHPHVHYMLWDNRDKIQCPFIHPSTQDKCREICQEAMFTPEQEAIIKSITKEEREALYAVQNTARSNITDFFNKLYKDDYVPGALMEKLPQRTSPEEHAELNQLYRNILKTLPGSGRIAYKFMPPECKAYIDRVSEIFLKRADIQNDYLQYIKAVEDIHKVLGKTEAEISKESKAAYKDLLRRTGNIVLKAVCDMKQDILSGPESTGAEVIFPSATIEEDGMLSVDEEMADFSEMIADIPLNESTFKEVNKFLTKGSDYHPGKAEALLRKMFHSGEYRRKDLQKIQNLLGKIYADNTSVLRDYQKALKVLHSSMEDRPNFNAASLLGKIYADKKGGCYQPTEAEKFYKEAIRLNPERSNFIKLKLSRLYMDAESPLYDCNMAVSILDDATDNKGAVSLQLGNIYNTQSGELYDAEFALENYEKSYEKGNAYGAFQYGRLLLDDRRKWMDMNKAVKVLERAVVMARRPRFEGDTDTQELIAADLKLAGIYLNENYKGYSIENAERCLGRALAELQEKQNQKFSVLTQTDREYKDSVYMYLGKCELAKGNIEAAKDFFQKSIQEPEESRKDVKDVVPVTRDNWATEESRIQLSKIYMEEKKCEEALKILTDTELQDKNGKIALQIGNIYADEKGTVHNMINAMDAYSRSAQKDNMNAKIKIANICLNQKYSFYNVDKAERILHTALGSIEEKQRENPEMVLSGMDKGFRESIYHALARCAVERGNMENAKQCYMKCIQANAMAEIRDNWTTEDARIQLSKIHMQEGNYGAALGVLTSPGLKDESGKIALQMGNIYAANLSPYYDMTKAMEFYFQAVQKENTSAMVKIGKCYLYGLGVERDREMARSFLMKAERRGDTYASEVLKKMDYQNNVFVPYTFMIAKQLLNGISYTKEQQRMKMQEKEFHSKSKQAKREEYLHRN